MTGSYLFNYESYYNGLMTALGLQQLPLISLWLSRRFHSYSPIPHFEEWEFLFPHNIVSGMDTREKREVIMLKR